MRDSLSRRKDESIFSIQNSQRSRSTTAIFRTKHIFRRWHGYHPTNETILWRKPRRSNEFMVDTKYNIKSGCAIEYFIVRWVIIRTWCITRIMSLYIEREAQVWFPVEEIYLEISCKNWRMEWKILRMIISIEHRQFALQHTFQDEKWHIG